MPDASQPAARAASNPCRVTPDRVAPDRVTPDRVTPGTVTTGPAQPTLRARLDEALYRLRELLRAASKLRGRVIDVEGQERHSGATLKLRYIGSGHGFAYWMDRVYGANFRIAGERPLLLVAAGRAFRQAPPDIPLILGDLPWPWYRMLRGSFLRMPGWVLQKTRLSADWDEIVSRFRKNTRSTDLRRVRKYRLSYRLTCAQADLEHFHDALFEPYTRRRFGHLINGDTREEIIHFGTREGQLLQILDGQTVVGGVVLSACNGQMHFLWLGQPEGLESGLADAVHSAIYLFSLQQAHAEGCHEMDFSLTRPLLNNGIYHYKRKWGSRLVDDWPQAEFQWLARRLDEPVTAFFTNHPMVLREAGSLTGSIVCQDPATVAELRRLVEGCYSEGLARLRVLLRRGVLDPDWRKALSDLAAVEWDDLSDLDDTEAAARLHGRDG